ncbi:hypothetical protein F4809DRAFT_413698 [Biscogniauxia mediterranea]|nr:hypothetical protein F4809DRAFT_413698 [Biscogniauxia mediterranea]
MQPNPQAHAAGQLEPYPLPPGGVEGGGEAITNNMADHGHQPIMKPPYIPAETYRQTLATGAHICTDHKQAELYEASRSPLPTNLWCCLRHMAKMFGGARIAYALFGGYAMVLRGVQRHTSDIEMLIDTNMETLVRILMGQRCIIFPENCSHYIYTPGWDRTAIHVYIDTGLLSRFRNPRSVPISSQIVSVYICICCGEFSKNMRLLLTLPGGSEIIEVASGKTYVCVIDVGWQLISKLHAYAKIRRGRSCIHFHDIQYLALKYRSDIIRWRGRIPEHLGHSYVHYILPFLEDFGNEMKSEVMLHKIPMDEAMALLYKICATLSFLPYMTREWFGSLPFPSEKIADESC